MITALMLIGLGAAWRLLIAFQVLDLPNAVPLTALTLYAAARLPRRWALVVPLGALLASDLVIDLRHGYPFEPASRLTVLGTFLVIVLASRYLPERVGLAGRVLAALAGSTFFFLATNFAVWVESGGFGFAHTFAGLLSTYQVALPFFRNMLCADVLGTVLLFGLEPLWARHPALAPVEQRVGQ